MKRIATMNRKTNETNISMTLDIDGSGKQSLDIQLGFLSHMLELFCKHGLFDLNIKARGDTNVDEHHTVEDIGIVLGQAFRKALADKKGIQRYGFFILPMDEAVVTVAIDLGGRYAFKLDCPFTRNIVGDLPTELVYDFFDAFAQNAKVNVFIKVEYGRNDHHKIEGIFKATARALRMACTPDTRAIHEVPSTKGIL